MELHDGCPSVDIGQCVCWLSIDSGVESTLFIRYDQHMKERYGAIISRFFTCELDVVIYGIYMFQEGIFV